MKQQRWTYFKTKWNLLELAIIILSWSALSVFIKRTLLGKQDMDFYQNNKHLYVTILILLDTKFMSEKYLVVRSRFYILYKWQLVKTFVLLTPNYTSIFYNISKLHQTLQGYLYLLSQQLLQAQTLYCANIFSNNLLKQWYVLFCSFFRYASFHETAKADAVLGYLIAFLVLLATIKLWYLLRLNPKLHMITATLQRAWTDISGFLVVMTIMFLAYSIAVSNTKHKT